MSSLEGKAIAITGGASGIGFSIAELVSKRGANVSLADVSEARLEQAGQLIRANGGQVVTHVVDVRKPEQIEAWMKATTAAFGRLDGVANMAGVSPQKPCAKGIIDQDQDDWEFVLGVNLTGVMNCLRSEMLHIADGGSIVNATSIMGLQGAPNSSSYAASKHGVIGLTRCVAKEAGARDIRVNCIAPGYIETPMLTSAMGEKSTEVGKTVPLRRIGQPEEVASLVAFLVGNESKYITSSVLTVDGGWHGL